MFLCRLRTAFGLLQRFRHFRYIHRCNPIQRRQTFQTLTRMLLDRDNEGLLHRIANVPGRVAVTSKLTCNTLYASPR